MLDTLHWLHWPIPQYIELKILTFMRNYMVGIAPHLFLAHCVSLPRRLFLAAGPFVWLTRVGALLVPRVPSQKLAFVAPLMEQPSSLNYS